MMAQPTLEKQGCVGISFMDLAEMFPDEQLASELLEKPVWAHGRLCPRYGCAETCVAVKT